MDILLKDLQPGQNYVVQVRAKGANGTYSSWSTVYELLTQSDVEAPAPVTSLNFDVNGTGFTATWTAPTTDASGDPLLDFKDYQIKLNNGSTDVIYYVTQPKFDFPFEANLGSFGSAAPSITATVKARDLTGNLSTAVSDSASNALPANVTGLTATGLVASIGLNWVANTDADLKEYRVYSGTTAGFTPGSGNLRYKGLGTSFTFSTASIVVHYFKVFAVDVFNQESASAATANATPVPFVPDPDIVAPSQPSAPTISTSTLMAQVSHDMTKQAGGDLEADVRYLEVHASVTTGFTPSLSTLRGTINAAALGIDVSGIFYFSTTDSMTNLYWKVIAVDTSGNKSSASNQSTGLPGLIANVNIGNAVITNAKIQDLDAAKLIAGTAIINDLFIQSVLTVDSSGQVQSDNYVTDTSGWIINGDGTAEFNNVAIRGSLYVSGAGLAEISLYQLGSGPSATPVMNFVSGGGAGYSIYTTDQSWLVQPLTPFDVEFHISSGNGIAMIDGFTDKGVLFDLSTKKLTIGSYDGTTWTPEVWTNLSLSNSWTAVSGRTPQYRKYPDGTVHFRGAASSGTTSDGTAFCSALPSAYRPPIAKTINIGSTVIGTATGTPRIQIGTDGTMLLFGIGASAGLRLDNTIFDLDS